MTRVATLVNILRAQGIEVGTLNSALTIGAETYPAGSYVIKLDQPYGRLAKNLLEKQDYPDPALTTYDDSGWSMGWAFDVDVKTISDKAILSAPTTLVKTATVKGTVAGNGTAAFAVAHTGSNNMITFRYKLKNVPMKVAEQSFTSDGVTFPAGSFIVTGSATDIQAARSAVESLGLSAAMLSSAPTVATHDADVPRVAIYSQWSGTQELGWYRFAFDQFGIPFDLIFKERVAKGDLKKDYDVILMAAQNVNKASVMAAPAAKPQPYQKTDKYKFLGMYGETADMSGGFGPARRRRDREVPRRRRHADHDASGGAVSDRVRSRAHRRHRGAAERQRAEAADPGGDHAHRSPGVLRLRQEDLPDQVRAGLTGLPRRRRRSGQRARAVRRRRRVGAERPDGRRRQHSRAGVRGGHSAGAQRERPGDHVREQPDLPLAEPRRVQHGLQLDHQLERRAAKKKVEGRAPLNGPSWGCRFAHAPTIYWGLGRRGFKTNPLNWG